MMPALDDMPLSEGLKACCEILRRVSAKAAALAATNARDFAEAFPLLAELEDE